MSRRSTLPPLRALLAGLLTLVALAPAGRAQPSAPQEVQRVERGTAVAQPQPENGAWTTHPPMPRALGAVSAATIDGFVYVVGRGHPQTLRYDPQTGTWIENLTWRQFKGDHHAAEVVDGRMFLIGGERNGSAGKVQIYDPAGDSWTYGAEMPWASASLASGVIDGLIYVAGGIDSGVFPTDRCAVYDPVDDTWTELTPMPEGRNHTASASDGERLWVFGGRGPESGAHEVAPGHDDVFVYDPATDTWDWSALPGSRLAPLPVPRASMGRAVFRDGEFFVMGGESKDGVGANLLGTYDRVDVYDTELGIWRTDALMPTARQGMYPVLLDDDTIAVAGGGLTPGGAMSDVFETLALPD